MSKVDEIGWAIKCPNGTLAHNKWGRSLWKVKPTNAVKNLSTGWGKFSKTHLVPIKVRICEVEDYDAD